MADTFNPDPFNDMSVKFGPQLDPIFSEVVVEMNIARLAGWSEAHDDAAGTAHLVQEARYRLNALAVQESPTDDEISRALTVAIGLLVNARLTHERALASGHTITLDGPAKGDRYSGPAGKGL